MASPQAEDGHTDIANEIIEALARIRLSGEEVQVLWVILRKTYGWHKKADAISYGQFSEMTGLSRPHVLRAVRKLLPKMVIRVTKNGNSNGNIYEFNKDFDQWKVLPKKVTVTNNGNTLLPKMGTKVLPKKVHTKEKKETIQKKESAKKIPPPTDELFWTEIKGLYSWLDIEHEIAKMRAYQLTERGKNWKMTRRSVVNWLNRAEKPIGTQGGKLKL